MFLTHRLVANGREGMRRSEASRDPARGLGETDGRERVPFNVKSAGSRGSVVIRLADVLPAKCRRRCKAVGLLCPLVEDSDDGAESVGDEKVLFMGHSHAHVGFCAFVAVIALRCERWGCSTCR